MSILLQKTPSLIISLLSVTIDIAKFDDKFTRARALWQLNLNVSENLNGSLDQTLAESSMYPFTFLFFRSSLSPSPVIAAAPTYFLFDASILAVLLPAPSCSSCLISGQSTPTLATCLIAEVWLRSSTLSFLYVLPRVTPSALSAPPHLLAYSAF